MRIGIGYDSHRFVTGRPLVLGGVIIAHEYGLDGHSDADVLLHAIADSILGAAGLGDIGGHFPDTDMQFKDMQSTKLLSEVFKMIVQKGFQVGNVDAVIIAEKPKLAPHLDAMKSKISRILVVTIDDIAVKATTNEQMGFVGREEGIAVIATSLLYKDHGTVVQPDK
ncbi:MAG: 2-C-methyl-D-erythritol 2,4-cyclodiphosphate synthase [candidate division Zixibacteria bacterium HGW-Zixibacteria-1]|nr:MAG: 2-C-methyl-D-erythritol 2,4-cyclodiphosphate synthase [candidate division Zixibacteria bacterium HGW-Zixibacteria-1]